MSNCGHLFGWYSIEVSVELTRHLNVPTCSPPYVGFFLYCTFLFHCMILQMPLLQPCCMPVKTHFHSGKFFSERKFCKMWLADTNFPSKISHRKWTFRACSHGQKLSRLARKLFDKFTSEISPCHENNMKSYTEFIWDESFPVYRDLACWQARSRRPG